MADTGADVTIRYSFLPTEGSIRESAERVVKQINRVGGKPLSVATGKRLTSEFDKTTDSIINFLRATQQKTSLQTKILSGMKFAGLRGGGEAGATGGEATGGIAGAAGGSGGILGALGAIAGILVVISVAMTLIGAFFEAVGPIIKVVVKMIGAMILILLMPFLKRGLPLLFGILKAMIDFSKTISGFVDAFLTYIEGAVGELAAGNPMGLIKLWLGPIGMVAIELLKMLIQAISKIDWNAIILAIMPILEGAFETAKNLIVSIVSTLFGAEFGGKVKAILDSIQRALFSDNPDFWGRIKDVINTIGTTIFGEETWNQIKDAIKFVQDCLNPAGMWEKIKSVINDIGENIFGKGLWDVMKSALYNLIDMIDSVTTKLMDAWNTSLGRILGPVYRTESVEDFQRKMEKFGAFTETAGKSIAQLTAELIAANGPTASTGDTYRYNPTTGKTTKQDFISRPGMVPQPFSSSDTIIGMKNPGALGGTNITNNLYVSAGVDKNEFRKILSDFNREQARELRMRSSYVAGVYS